MKTAIGNVLNIADASRQGILNRAAFAAKVPLLMACINALGGVFAKQKLLVAIAAGMLLLSTCFSPWAGNGNLTITWGNSGGGRWIDPSNLPNYDYTVTLRGPGGTIEKKFAKGVPSGSFNVVPGTWNVTVKGYVIKGNEGYEYLELYVMGIEQIEVKPGQGNRETIAMYSVEEIDDWNGFNKLGKYSPETALDGIGNRSLMILITEDLVADSSLSIPVNVPFIFVAERDVTISRASGYASEFFKVYSGQYGDIMTLTLGKNGMGGTLTLDGQLQGSNIAGQPPIAVLIDRDISMGDISTLNMYNGVTIKNNRDRNKIAPGVDLYLSSEFYMDGGTITGNDIGVKGISNDNFKNIGGTVSGNGTNLKSL
jgi:hypothetical protein